MSDRSRFRLPSAMACNIDAKGRALRLGLGVPTLALAMILALAAWWGGWAGWAWISAAALASLGGFLIYEGRRGWCAIRAMGFRTRM